MAFKMLLAFLIVLLTGITLRIPSAAWFTVGFSGMMGWTINWIIVEQGFPRLVAVVAGAFVVGLLAEVFARLQKQPVTVYIVSGIIPLVPGTMTYNSMMAFMESKFTEGLVLLFRAFLIASYLAAGLALPSLLVRNIKSMLRRLTNH